MRPHSTAKPIALAPLPWRLRIATRRIAQGWASLLEGVQIGGQAILIGGGVWLVLVLVLV